MLIPYARTAQWLRSGALVLVVLVGGCSSCESRPKRTAPSESDLAEQPAHESWGTELYLSEDGLPLVVITAPYTRQYDREDSTVTVLSSSDQERVVATIMDEEGQPSSTVTADEIRYMEESRQFEALGAVVVVTDTDRLETEQLSWDEDSDMIYAPGFVRIYTPDENIQGYELESTKNLSTYSLTRVTGQVYIDE